MPVELCCATLHIKILSCNEEGPVENVAVSAARVGIPPDEPETVVVAEAHTDDTGTVTMLVGDEGTYFITADYNDGFAYKTVVAECGVNNVEVLFAATDKICVRLSPAEYVGPSIAVTVERDGAVVDACSLGTGATRCCISIPGPGTYTLASDESTGTFEPETVEVGEEDCGDKLSTLSVPTAGETCERTLNLDLCGCPAVGVGVLVRIPNPPTGDYVVTSTFNAEGTAFFTVPIALCDNWTGSDYEVDLPGVFDTLTGTVGGDGMVIPDPGASTFNWCYPDCVGPMPGSLFWTPGVSWPEYVRFPQSLARTADAGGPGIAGWYGINELNCIEDAWFMETRVVIPRSLTSCDTAPNAYIKVDIYGPPGTCQHEDVPFSEFHTTIPLSGNMGELYCPVNLNPGGGTLTE